MSKVTQSDNFFKKLFKLTTDFSYYHQVYQAERAQVIRFFFAIVLVYAVLMGSYVATSSYLALAPIVDQLGSTLETMQISNGQMSLYNTNQIEATNDTADIGVLLVADQLITNAKNELPGFNNKLILAQDGLYIELAGTEFLREQYQAEMEPITISGAMLTVAKRQLFWFLLIVVPLLMYINGVVAHGFTVLFFSLVLSMMLPLLRLNITKPQLTNLCVYALAPGIIFPAIIFWLGLGNPFIGMIVYLVVLWMVLVQFRTLAKS